MIGVQAWLAYERARCEGDRRLTAALERLETAREERIKWEPLWHESLEDLTATRYSQIARLTEPQS